MLQRCTRFLAVLILASLAMGASSNGVVAFTISPMKVMLPPAGGARTIKVKNPSDEPIDMQLQIFGWNDSINLKALEPTDDLLAMPPVFQVEAGGEQVIRVALRRPLKTEIERSYRILVKEVPSQTVPDEGLGFNISVSLPIFVRPEGAVAAPVWKIEKQQSDGLHLVLANEGNAYLKVGKVTLAASHVDAEPIFEADGGYVLGGDRRMWPLEVDHAGLEGPITVRAETTSGPIEAEISLPDR